MTLVRAAAGLGPPLWLGPVTVDRFDMLQSRDTGTPTWRQTRAFPRDAGVLIAISAEDERMNREPSRMRAGPLGT
jgi:hypothetical protein